MIVKRLVTLVLFMGTATTLFAQKAYFADGYHGGIWGHFPEKYTGFMMDQLRKNPGWKLNLEIEPVTWDAARQNDPAAYRELQRYLSVPPASSRVEIVNPSYGQSYFYTISGESIIRQFAYGIRKTREHFPKAVFQTYASEEPCFTSALPQILRSFGFRYASLKNPNTCWGGYTRAHGGELVNWIGPDGSTISTVPRYAGEALRPGSTWETMANLNKPEYVRAALDQGIKHPLGMTLQDAGWRGGPYLGDGKGAWQPTEYVTYSHYFGAIADPRSATDWRLSQEDIQVSLVWGAQVLQRIAQQVRHTENLLVSAEKIAAMAKISGRGEWNAPALDSAWQNLLLAQHHDCWIVPYNGKPGDTWADKVKAWTGASDRIAGNIIDRATQKTVSPAPSKGRYALRVYNTTGYPRNEVIGTALPPGFSTAETQVQNHRGENLPAQMRETDGKKQLAFRAGVPAAGYTTFYLVKKAPAPAGGTGIQVLRDGNYELQTDLYRIIVDPKAGGIIRSLQARKLDNREFVDLKNERGFNELRGNFYTEGGFRSSRDSAATCTVLDNGPLLLRLAISGHIAGHPFTQVLSLRNGDPRIDLDLTINWQGSPGIGAYAETNYTAENRQKAFYDDRAKLLALFPLALKDQKVYKDAPFDVTESTLDNTFFTRWDSIKNNVISTWVDIREGGSDYGFALLTDHTGNYAHGSDHPLGLTLQYAGTGLWGRNYRIDGPTQLRYAFIPHKGDWNRAGIAAESGRWQEPLQVVPVQEKPDEESERSFVQFNRPGLQLSSMVFDGNDLLLRIYNAEGDDTPFRFDLHFGFAQAQEVTLNGEAVKQGTFVKGKPKRNSIELAMPRFGFKTLRLKGVDAHLQ
ncbi:MAG: glycosyl hydrolase [Mucilaginibacter polytrichastri]|nr:glycosyl hydrolase [Mucilaginibacter polytrichastri]